MRAENRTHLGPGDVVLAAHPGSGASWIGTLLVHLGIFYLSGEDELLVDGVSQRARPVEAASARPLPGAGAGQPANRAGAQLERLPTLRDRDRRGSWREPCRVVKTNQSALGWTPPGKVVLLVRDGRDALLSLYHHLSDFSDLDVPLRDFLTGNDGAWLPPPTGWGLFCMSWMGSMPDDRLHVLRFEACKANPVDEFASLLDFLGIARSRAELQAAVEASSYDAMRAAEGAALAQSGATDGRGRIMRRGLVGEWREVYDAAMLQTFAGMPRRALDTLGYPVDAIPRLHSVPREEE